MADYTPAPAMAAARPHFWFGRWLDARQLDAALQALPVHLDATLPASFPLHALLEACARIGQDLQARQGCYTELLQEACRTSTPEDADAMLQAMAAQLSRDAMQEKLRSELGSHHPGDLQRRYPGPQFEAWAPCGCVVHVAPANVFTVAALGLVEGLMAGNVNVVKLSARDGRVAALFAATLVAADARLAPYVAVLALPSSAQETLRQLLACADVVSAWGGEQAVAAIRALTPPQARLVAWGHKVSLGYIAADCVGDDALLRAFARDMCRLDQQACSSPQTLMVEAEPEALPAVARRLAALLAEESPRIPGQTPDTAEQAEITSVLSVARAEQALGLTEVIEDPQGRWRILLDTRPGLRPAPLYRTIWLTPVRRTQLGGLLRPMRAWLQTCGLAAGPASVAPLTRQLLAAGITRITRPGEMIDSYLGAPHDGVYALQQLARRVSVDGGAALQHVGRIDMLLPPALEPIPSVPILDKSGFQALEESAPGNARTGLIVRSGGSSGQVAYSRFRWADYHAQMAATGDGLVAAGLEPTRDRVMNLFAAGNLYGGFISFWTILEQLGVLQLPMGLEPDYALVADEIIAHRANTLIGVPPHLLGLFAEQGQRLRDWGGVQKIFYGGEALSEAQQRFLTDDCGVALVRSAAYGSNDAGPMGYQCRHSHGTVHHLHTRLQTLEIVEPERDMPVQGNAVGRLLLTPLARSAPRIERYEIGDLGRWVPGPCACGSQEPRFELMGRLGDVFKVGPLMNFRYFADSLSQRFDHAGAVQIHLSSQGPHNVIEVWVGPQWRPERSAEAVQHWLTDYEPLRINVAAKLPLKLRICPKADADFVRNAVSGKIIHVCDHRVGT